jgi:hypothetical protein
VKKKKKGNKRVTKEEITERKHVYMYMKERKIADDTPQEQMEKTNMS